MHHHRISGASPPAPSRVSAEHECQRRVLLELVTNPPPEGDDVSRLAAVLHERRHDVEAAIDALVAVGLAKRDVHTARPTAAALRFDALWPAL
jgi:hypothetical protein